MSLYSIATEYQNALNNAFDFDSETGELLNNIDALSRLEGTLEDKSINIAAYIKNLEAESSNIDEAIKNMRDRKEKLSNKIENLTNHLKSCLQRCGIKEITKSPYFKIKLRLNPPSVFINSESLIPEEFKVIKQIISIDKAAIKEAIQSGKRCVNGAELIQLTRLEIK